MPSFDRPSKLVTSHSSLFQKHQQILSHYPSNPKPSQPLLSEAQILQSNHIFIRDSQDVDTTWEQRLAKKYYDKLFKEYALTNLDFYKQSRIALRWRTEQEVMSGKGQFVCGSIKCAEADALTSWEVPFAYSESGEKKVALVKLKLCKECALKLNYRSIKNKRKRERDGDIDSQEHKADNKAMKREVTEEIEEEPEIAKEDESALWTAPVKAQTAKEEDEDFDMYLNDIFS